jgi:EpsI family protein
MQIDGYTAVEDRFSQAVYDELNADKHVYRHYQNRNGDRIDLYIGYYGTAKGGRTPHNPYACLTGAGWGIVKTDQVTLEAPYTGGGVLVNSILAQKGDTYENVLNWYQSSGTKVLNSGVKQNIQRFVGRVFHNRNDGAFVRVSAFSTKEDIKKTNRKITNFAEKILALLPEFWPEERCGNV